MKGRFLLILAIGFLGIINGPAFAQNTVSTGQSSNKTTVHPRVMPVPKEGSKASAAKPVESVKPNAAPIHVRVQPASTSNNNGSKSSTVKQSSTTGAAKQPTHIVTRVKPPTTIATPAKQ